MVGEDAEARFILADLIGLELAHTAPCDREQLHLDLCQPVGSEGYFSEDRRTRVGAGQQRSPPGRDHAEHVRAGPQKVVRRASPLRIRGENTHPGCRPRRPRTPFRTSFSLTSADLPSKNRPDAVHRFRLEVKVRESKRRSQRPAGHEFDQPQPSLVTPRDPLLDERRTKSRKEHR